MAKHTGLPESGADNSADHPADSPSRDPGLDFSEGLDQDDDPAPAAHSGAEACARAWTTLTAAHARIADHLTSALARHCSLSINDFEILLRLEPAPPPGLRLGDLRSAVRLTQPSLSRAVTRLAQRGWLAQAETATD